LTQIKSILNNSKFVLSYFCEVQINNLYQCFSCLYNLGLYKKISVLVEDLRKSSVLLHVNKVTILLKYLKRREVIGDTKATRKYNHVAAVKRLISYGSYTVQF
jgi:hypothetical protein